VICSRLILLIFVATLMTESVKGQLENDFTGQFQSGSAFVAGPGKQEFADTSLSQAASGQLSPGSQHSSSELPESVTENCAYLEHALRAAEQRLDHDQKIVTSTRNPEESPPTEIPMPSAIDLLRDRKLLEHNREELEKCVVWIGRAKRKPRKDCLSSEFFEFHAKHNDEPAHDVLLLQRQKSSAFFFESSLSVDADGAPNAYHRDNLGLDDLTNAGAPGSWPGLASDTFGEPYIQSPADPFPGYYVSATDLSDATKAASDPARYVDASQIPYVVLPEGIETQTGARLGDFAMVFNLQNGKRSPAIYADTGPADRIGEGSIALAEKLGLWSDARSGGTTRGILYLLFSGSGDGRPKSLEEIESEAEQQFRAWGGDKQLAACGLL
jgi:hypothetical protein